jgi:oligopeptide/dipeptide ABC transporter ATP-binding protein
MEETALDPPAPARPRFRPGQVWLRAFLGAPSGYIGLAAISAIVVVAIVCPPLLTHRANTSDFLNLRAGMSWSHPFGTDPLGRDIFAQVLVASRLSLELALGAAAIAFVVGVSVGSIAALVGPSVRPVILRVIDTMLSFPALLTAIFVTVIIGRGGTGAMIGVGFAFSFALARVASTLALSLGGREYINAARVLGVSRTRLFLRYVLPGILEPLIISTSVVVTLSIITVSALSFLGLGVQAPKFDWGGLMVTGIQSIYVTPAAALGPAAAIALAAMAFGFTGEAIARAMNPRLWTRTVSAAAGTEERVEAEVVPISSAQAIDDPLQERGEPVLEVEDLIVSFPGAHGRVDVVKGVSVSVARGEIVGIVGESGSGKTMTALAVAQLTPYPGVVKGRIRMFGRELLSMPRRELDRLLGTRFAVVFQDPMSSLNPALRIGTQLTQGVRVHRRLKRSEARALASRALSEVHIPAAERQLSRFPHEFSGGMRQRAMIAMGLMKDPEVLIADEPTTALDVTIQAQVMELLQEVNAKHGTAILLITHNLALVSQNCHRVLVMYAGRIVEDLDAKQLQESPAHPYTQALLGAIPDIRGFDLSQLHTIPGEVPDIGAPPPGCAFHPRCPLAVGRCSVEVPALRARPDRRRLACHVANADLVADSEAVAS